MGLILGFLFGMLELIPNAHPQILALVVLPMLGMGLGDNLLFVAAMLTTSLVMHSLSHTYHPIPNALLPHAEAAQKLAYEGLGPMAMKIQHDCIIVSLIAAAAITPVLIWLKPGIKLTLVPLTIILAGMAIWKSKSKITGLIVLGAAVAVGIKAQSFGHEGMTPLLVGMFTLPPLFHIIFQKGAAEIIPDQPTRHADDSDRQAHPADIALGAIAALLPGISASSMVHLRKSPDSTESYLGMSAIQHNVAMFTAIFLLAAGGGPHSAAAVALFSSQDHLPPVYSYLTILFGCGAALVPAIVFADTLEPWYKLVAQYFPQQLFAWIFIPVGIWLSYHHAGIPGLCLTAAAVGVSFMQKQGHVPNQVLLQALTIPMVMKII